MTTGSRSGMPRACRINSVSRTNSAVTIAAEGTPSLSSAIVSRMQDEQHDPQSPMAVRTMSFSLRDLFDQLRCSILGETMLHIIVHGRKLDVFRQVRQMRRGGVCWRSISNYRGYQDANLQGSSCAGRIRVIAISTKPRGSNTRIGTLVVAHSGLPSIRACTCRRCIRLSDIGRGLDNGSQHRCAHVSPSGDEC